MFICDKCGKSLSTRKNLDYHLKHNACKTVHKVICEFCNKEYIHKSSLDRHQKTCPEKVAQEEPVDTDKQEIFTMFAKMQEQIDELRKENKELKSTKTSKAINNGNINNVNGDMIVNNIMLVGYGKEDLSKVDQADLLRGMRSGFNSTLNLIDAVHFNPKYPEFHNVYISSMKNKYAMMYDGSNWALVMKDDLIDKLYDDKRNYIEENLDEFLDSLTRSQRKALHRWMDADDTQSDNHPYIKKIKNDIKLLLYNKRNLALKNRSKIKDSLSAPIETIACIDKGQNNDTNVSDVTPVPTQSVSVKDVTNSPFRLTHRLPTVRATKSSKSSKFAKRMAGRPGTKRKIVRNLE